MEEVDIFKPVRDHYEVKYDGRSIYIRGKRDWEMRARIDIARKMFSNIDECFLKPNAWIIGEPLEPSLGGK
jgi:hypothetical protein